MLNLKYMPAYLTKIYETVEHPKIWALLSFIGILFTKYIFSQWIFALGFFIIFICDTFSGAYIAWRKKEYSGKILRDKLMDKSVAYFMIIISFSVATKITLQDSNLNLIQYLNIPVYTLFTLVELKSVIRNWYTYTKWPWLGLLINWLEQKNPLKDSNAKLTDADQIENESSIK